MFKLDENYVTFDSLKKARTRFCEWIRQSQNVTDGNKALSDTALHKGIFESYGEKKYNGHLSVPKYEHGRPHFDQLQNACRKAFGGKEFGPSHSASGSPNTQKFRRGNVISLPSHRRCDCLHSFDDVYCKHKRDACKMLNDSLFANTRDGGIEKVTYAQSPTPVKPESRVCAMSRLSDTSASNDTVMSDQSEARCCSFDDEHLMVKKRKHSTKCSDLYAFGEQVVEQTAKLFADVNTSAPLSHDREETGSSAYRQVPLTPEKENERFSRNYSIFVQQSSISIRQYMSTPRMSQSLKMKSTRSMWNNLQKRCSFDLIGKELNESASREHASKPKYISHGLVKISIQHFNKSKQLRIILMKASNLLANQGVIFAKVALITGKKTKQHYKTRKIDAEHDELIYNEEIYFHSVDPQTCSDLVLRVRLYKTTRRFFSRSKCIGEMVISLDEYDMSLDTTLKCILRPKRPSYPVVFTESENLLMMSEDRSILSQAAVCLNDINSQHTSIRRSQSMPLQKVLQF